MEYLLESLSLDQVRDYMNIKRDPKAQIYMNAFWQTLQEYVLSHGGKESHNKYRLYIPYKGPKPQVDITTGATNGNLDDNIIYRNSIQARVQGDMEEHGYTIEKWNYIDGTMDISFQDNRGNTKIRKDQKIGKVLAKICDETLINFFKIDPIRLGKNISSAIDSNNLWIVISNHAYDIAGMSTNRDWTSCMNILNGENKEYVAADIEFGTLIAYIIDKNDTNIEHPYGRILIKPYKLSRKGYLGKDAAPVVYAPEVTVYSPYIGLKPIREWLKDICEEIQEGEGMLKNFKQLYSDSFHDKVDRRFKGKNKKL